MLPLFSRAEFERAVVEHPSKRHAPDWVFDPHLDKASEVESLHHGRDLDHTVEVIHSKLERHGERYEQLPALFERPGAWQGILELCARTFESEAANAAKEGE